MQKTIMFLHVDERWEPLRSYLFATIGDRKTTAVFGVIIALVCPIMFGIQNLMLGMCLFEQSTNNVAQAFRHVVQSMRYQLVVLYDLTLLSGRRSATKQSQWCGVVRIVVGYLLYALPICCLITLSIYGKSKLTVCVPLNATFLLDNDVEPVFNMSNLYRLRQELGQENRNQLNSEGGMVWNKPWGDYWPLENITDLIKQYNFMGLHDICIYPMHESLTWVETPYRALHHGYAVHNSSGTD